MTHSSVTRCSRRSTARELGSVFGSVGLGAVLGVATCRRVVSAAALGFSVAPATLG
jgi:hypothetical protein